MIRINRRLDRYGTVSLKGASFHASSHFGRGVADVDLPAGDVILSAIEGDGFCEAGDSMFGCGVGGRIGSWNMGRNRAVVNDASATRALAFHDLERLLRA